MYAHPLVERVEREDLTLLTIVSEEAPTPRRITSGPSCSKHCYLNELVSGQNVNCSSKYNI